MSSDDIFGYTDYLNPSSNDAILTNMVNVNSISCIGTKDEPLQEEVRPVKDKRQKRLARNRISARESRKRKKMQLEFLIERSKTFVADVGKLRRLQFANARKNLAPARAATLAAISENDDITTIEDQLNDLELQYGPNNPDHVKTMDFCFKGMSNLVASPYLRFLLWITKQGTNFFTEAKPTASGQGCAGGLWVMVAEEMNLDTEQQDKMKQLFKQLDINEVDNGKQHLCTLVAHMVRLRHCLAVSAQGVQDHRKKINSILNSQQRLRWAKWLERSRGNVRRKLLDPQEMLANPTATPKDLRFLMKKSLPDSKLPDVVSMLQFLLPSRSSNNTNQQRGGPPQQTNRMPTQPQPIGMTPQIIPPSPIPITAATSNPLINQIIPTQSTSIPNPLAATQIPPQMTSMGGGHMAPSPLTGQYQTVTPISQVPITQVPVTQALPQQTGQPVLQSAVPIVPTMLPQGVSGQQTTQAQTAQMTAYQAQQLAQMQYAFMQQQQMQQQYQQQLQQHQLQQQQIQQQQQQRQQQQQQQQTMASQPIGTSKLMAQQQYGVQSVPQVVSMMPIQTAQGIINVPIQHSGPIQPLQASIPTSTACSASSMMIKEEMIDDPCIPLIPRDI
eukprot:TRINITY_DN307_c6_g1_i1.p1 TRINITY_DN307_c6_g1~~TRINITY_DN307_c6_g1_i1.p1  ORF type:complete len:615 (-),score=191.73 TRINITY_DN307_c6_g1_i1:536-2380(-)